jgi:ABC-type lipoprotein export system ATPase subunit
LRPEASDDLNSRNNLFDKHFDHQNEPNSIVLRWKVTANDISAVKQVLNQKTELIDFLSNKVLDELGLIGILQGIGHDTDYSFLKDKEIEIEFTDVQNQNNPSILNISDFVPGLHSRLNDFLLIVRNINVFYELSSIYSKLKLAPQSRYIGPHRQVGAIGQSTHVDLTATSTYEDTYSKGTNMNRENGANFISQAPARLAALTSARKTTVIGHYNEYLRDYLKAVTTITKGDVRYKEEYTVNFKRLNGSPLKLSSGEKEFFNLISALILSQIKNGVVLIDEPELHLHSKWQEVIIDLIKNLSQQYNLQFLIITHSPKFISQATVRYINHVSMKDYSTKVIQPDLATINSTRTKDLLALLSTTNNEKVFFSDKVILVEGTSDLLVYTDIVLRLKKQLTDNQEIEIVPAFSKNQFFNFAYILTAWHIPCYIVSDLDFVKEVLAKYSKENPGEMTRVKALNEELKSHLNVNRSKFRNILNQENKDGQTFIDVLLSKDSVSQEDFLSSMDKLLEYLKLDRASQLKKDAQVSEGLKTFIAERKQDKIHILSQGALEAYFTRYDNDKIENALTIVKHGNSYPDELVDIFRQIIEDH